MPGGTLLVRAPRIVLNGQPVSDAVYDAVVDLRVEHTMSVPARLTIRFADPAFTLLDADTFAVAGEIAISFADELGTMTEVFTGEIVTVGAEQSADRLDGCELVVTAYDFAHRLGHASQVISRQKMKYSDVVSAIARQHGLQPTVTDSAVTHDYLLQTGTDYEYLNDIAYRLGWQWRVESKTLHFGPRVGSTPIELTYGEDLRRIKVRFTAAEQSTSFSVRGWDPAQKKAIVGTGTAPNDVTIGSDATLGAGVRKGGKTFAKPRLATTLPVASKDEGDSVAKGIAARFSASGVAMRAEALGNPAVKLGAVVKIANAGTKLSGQYYVTAVEHIFGRGTDYLTRFSSGGLEPASIVDTLGRGSGPVETFGKIGLVVGVVTNNKDPDGLGRVRVKLPALSDEVDSHWARVAMVGAGSGRGMVVLPQIDDEVLVGFEQGDLRKPFVLGGLWNSKTKPPVANDILLGSASKVVQWSMVTGGHSLVLRGADDDPNKHFKLSLSDAKTILYVGADKIEVVASNKPIEIKNGKASIVLTATGDVQISGENVKITANQDVTIEGLNVNTKAKTGVKVEAGTTLGLKGGASAKVEASGVTEVKGAMVKIN